MCSKCRCQPEQRFFCALFYRLQDTPQARQRIRARNAPGTSTSPPSSKRGPPTATAAPSGKGGAGPGAASTRPAAQHAKPPAAAKRPFSGWAPFVVAAAALLLVGAVIVNPDLLRGGGGSQEWPPACTEQPDDARLASVVPSVWADWSVDLADAVRGTTSGGWRSRRQAVTGAAGATRKHRRCAN